MLFVAHDAGGTIPPLLAVAGRLIDAGHEVTILSQTSVAARAEALGCRFQAFSTVDDYASDTPIEEQLSTVSALLFDEAPVREALELATEVDASIVVVDPNLAGFLAAFEADSRPTAVLLHSLYATFVEVWFSDVWAMAGTAINQIRARYGLTAATSWAGLFDGHDLVLSPAPEEFNPSPIEAANLHHVGFLVPPAREEVSFGQGSAPRVLVSLSTTFQSQHRALQAIIDALGDLPVQAMVTTAGVVPKATLRAPANVTVEAHVPHAAVLGSCDLVVTHGGLGTVSAALAHGVPLVCQPVGRDQPLNAERVRALGAGVVLDADAPAAAIAGAITDALHDASYRDRAQRLARASREAGGVTAAVDAILHLTER